MPVGRINKETEAERIDRRKQVQAMLAQREMLYQEVSQQGFVRPTRFLLPRDRPVITGKAAETHRIVDADRFLAAIRRLPPEREQFLTPYTIAEYRQMGGQIILSKSGKVVASSSRMGI